MTEQGLARAIWGDVYRAMRSEGVSEEHSMAHADVVRIEVEKRLAAPAVPSLTVSPARLYDALWLLKASRYGDDDEFPTLPEVRVALEVALATPEGTEPK